MTVKGGPEKEARPRDAPNHPRPEAPQPQTLLLQLHGERRTRISVLKPRNPLTGTLLGSLGAIVSAFLSPGAVRTRSQASREGSQADAEATARAAPQPRGANAREPLSDPAPANTPSGQQR